MIIRQATGHDTPAILELCESLGYAAESNAIRRRVNRLTVSDRDCLLVAADDAGDRAIAWIHVFETHRVESAAFAEIGGFIVHRDHRRRGIGSAMINEAAAWARQRGLATLRVRCNAQRKDGNAFYESDGFTLNKVQKVWQKKT